MRKFSLLLIAATCFGQSTPDTFLRLRDTPDTYAGSANKYVRVNAAANKLEFVSGGGGGGAVVFTDLTDVPSSYTGASLQSVRVNSGETGLEFFTATGVPTSRTLTIGGTAQDLSADRSWLGSVTNDAQTKASIVSNTAPSSGQILVGNAGGTAYAKQTLSGSGATATLSSAGVLTLSAIANASLANAAVASLSGTNTGDQTSIVGITGTLAEFNTALTGADFASGGGTATGTNTGDQTSIVGITGTKAQFDTAVTDGNILYVGDVTVPIISDTAYNATSWDANLDGASKNALRDKFEITQPLDADLTTIAGLTATTDNFMVSVASNWASRTPSQVRTTLALVIGTDVQAFDTDLTTWAGITPGANVGTFLATPSSANLRGALTDENGTGVALFNGATKPDFTSGFTISAAAASGKIPIGDGTSYVASTPTYPNAPGPAGYTVRSDATNFTSYPTNICTTSIAQQTWAATEAYLTGSTITVTAGDWKQRGLYHCGFDLYKTSVAGTATPIIKIYMGTLGTTGDTLIATLTFAAQTAVADEGRIEVWCAFRAVGAGTTAILQCNGSLSHRLAATGLSTSGTSVVKVTSAGFNSTTPTKIGISCTFGTSFVGTTELVMAELDQP